MMIGLLFYFLCGKRCSTRTKAAPLPDKVRALSQYVSLSFSFFSAVCVYVCLFFFCHHVYILITLEAYGKYIIRKKKG